MVVTRKPQLLSSSMAGICMDVSWEVSASSVCLGVEGLRTAAAALAEGGKDKFFLLLVISLKRK